MSGESPYRVFLPALRVSEVGVATRFLPGVAFRAARLVLTFLFVATAFFRTTGLPRAVFFAATAFFRTTGLLRAVFFAATAFFPEAVFLVTALRKRAALFFLTADAAPEAGRRVRFD